MKRRFLAMLLSVAMVLTMLPVTAFASDGEGAESATPQATALQALLTVRAIKSAGESPTITLKVTETENDTTSPVTEFYYKAVGSSDSLTAPNEGDTVTTEQGSWTKYEKPFAANEVGKVQVVTVTTETTGGSTTLKAAKYGEATQIYDVLGELTVDIGTEADPNAIVVKEGNENCNDTISYYRLDAEKIEAFKTAKADWASDITLTSVSETLGTAISPDPSKVTEADNGKYLVAVVVESSNLSKIGVTSVPVTFTRPFKLYAGEVASGSETTATDLIADATYDSTARKYVVTVPAGTEKVTVGTGASITNPTGETVSGNVVTLSTTGTTSISITASDSSTHTVDVTPVTPAVKNGKDNSVLTLGRNGSTYTYETPLDHDVEFVTVSGPEGGCKVTSVTNGTETTTTGTVYLNDGTNNLGVSFDDGGKCTVVITRKAAAPAVALYEGEKATGTDLLADLTADQSNVYEVSVPSTVEKVTVGAKASTIASVKYTPPAGGNATDAANNTVPLSEGLTTIAVKFADNEANPTEFTIKVTKAKAFVPLKVTKADDGKVVVARAEGTGEVPTGLDVVVLAKEPTWTAATTQAQVTTDTTNALVGSVAYNADTTTAPAAGESDKYVVVYKVDDGLVVAFGVLTVEKEERSITVNATDTDTGLLNFDSSIHEYTISIPADVADATVVCGPGAARISCDKEITDNVVAKKTGEVSTVTVTFSGVENGEYKIKLVWAKDVGDITPNNQKVTTTPTDGNVNLVEGDAEVSILQAISSTSAVNEDKGSDNPVEITATTTEGNTATTTVNLPASAAELLKDTETDAKVVTDAGEVTIPSEAIKQTQPGTEDSPAAPVAIAVVVAKKTANDDAEAGIVEAAKFEVTVKKATEDGMVDAGIKDLAKPITLVFKVRKDAIGDMKNPRLAHVKPAATVGGKPTYEKLPEAPEPTFDEATQIYTFTGKTSHLSEFAVVAEEATTEPVTPGPNITDITLENVDGFTFNSSATEPFEVTAKPAATEVSITVTADSYTNVVVGSSADSTTGDSPCDGKTPVKFTLSNEGKATIYVKINGTPVYTINVSKEADPTVKEITNIKLTDKTGKTAVEGFTFAKATTTYTVETDITPVLVTVEGDTDNVTVNGTKYTEAVEVEPTAAGTKVTIAYGDGTAQKYEITLKTKSTTPVNPDAPVTKVFIGDEEQKVTFKANENGEMVSEQVLSLESTDKVVTLTVAEGAKIALDDGEFASVLVGNTYPVEVEESGDHTITVTDSEGKNPYIINLNKKSAVVDETDEPTIGDTETPIKFDQTNEDGSKENKTPITVASSASFRLNVKAGAKVYVDGEEKTPTDGVITLPVGAAPGLHTIVIENSDGSKYIVNVEKQAAPGSLTAEQNGMTVSTYANVEIRNVKAGKYYLVEITVPATRGSKETSSYMVLEGDSYPSGVAKIAPAAGCKVVVDEYNSLADLSSGKTSAITGTARCNTTLITD